MNLFIAQFINIAVLALWITLSVSALFALRRRKLTEMVRVLWAILIVLVPILGALAFRIVRPGLEQTG